MDTIEPKLQEELDDVLKKTLPSLEANLVAEENHDQRLIDMKLIEELESLDDRFYALIDRKKLLDPKLLDELRQKEMINKHELTTNSDQIGEIKSSLIDMKSSDDVVQTNSEQINWFDELSMTNKNETIEPENETIEMDNNEGIYWL